MASLTTLSNLICLSIHAKRKKAMKENKEKQQILIYKKLESAKVCHFRID